MKRKELRNWLFATADGPATPLGNPWGLPEEGPGSRARLGRRVVALLIDWWASWLVAYLIFGDTSFGALGVFAVMQFVLLATMGASFGHRLTGMQVYRIDVLITARELKAPELVAAHRGIGVVSALIRTVLLCLVIPAVVWDVDGRGLHDKAARTILLRR